MLHERLWKSTSTVAQACLAHPFVQGLAEGTLERETFKRYVGQDAYFLKAFLKSYALAAVKCDDLDDVTAFHDLMGGVLAELNLHDEFARKWDIDLAKVTPLPATRAYTDFLLRTAWEAEVGEILAAMAPCMRLYAWLGEQLVARRTPEHPYGEWLVTYSSSEFAQLAERLEWLLDEHAGDTPSIRAAYAYAMDCELAFFSAAWEAAS